LQIAQYGYTFSGEKSGQEYTIDLLAFYTQIIRHAKFIHDRKQI